MIFMDGFRLLRKGLGHVITLIGGEAILKSFIRDKGEKMVRQYISYWEYGLTKKVPPLVEDMYQLAMVEIQKHWPNEATLLRARLKSYNNSTQDHFRITAVILPAEESDPKQRKEALGQTIEVFRMYARMNDKEWEHEITNLNIQKVEKDSRFQEILKATGVTFQDLSQKFSQNYGQASEDFKKTGIPEWSERLRLKAENWAKSPQTVKTDQFGQGGRI